MNKKAENLWADLLFNRWTVTHETAGGTVNAATTAPLMPKHVHVMDNLVYNITNTNATAHTVTVQVREGSLAGTVIWALTHLVGASSTAHVGLSGVGIKAPAGDVLRVTTDTFLASVKASVAMSGWIATGEGA